VGAVEVGAAEEDAKECGAGRGGVGIFLMEESGSEEGWIEAGLRLFDKETKTGGQGEGLGEGQSNDDGGRRWDGVESREFSVDWSEEGLCCPGRRGEDDGVSGELTLFCGDKPVGGVAGNGDGGLVEADGVGGERMREGVGEKMLVAGGGAGKSGVVEAWD
jgi:hypothetical protein